MTQELKEKIARNAASGWCRCFKCDGIIRENRGKCDKETLTTCLQWYHGYRTALLELDDDRIFESMWKPADGDDLPEIDREVVVLYQPYPCEGNEYAVGFGHRPKEYWDGRNIETDEVTRYYPKRYDKGGWNVPDVKFWLDLELPTQKGE